MNELIITYVQCELVWENPSQNRENIKSLLIKEAKPTDLIVLPEMFTTGFTMDPSQIAEEYDPNMETILWMKEITHQMRCSIMGSIAVKAGGKFYNRMLVCTKDGNISFYDKKHLFSLTKEDKKYSPGTKELILEVNGWKIFPQICYDLRFPEGARNTISNGSPKYDVLIYSANWPKTRIEQWKALIRARAIENQCYALGVNRIGKDENNLEYSGDSIAYNFQGDLITNNQQNDALVHHICLNKKELLTYREKFPFLFDQ